MQPLTFARPALGVCLLISLLAGCGASQPPLGVSGSMPQVPTKAAHPDRGRSWMSPNATGMELLYISDIGTGDVDVYSYPHPKLVGTLTGFSGNQGECTDSNGHVYVVTTAAIYEYAHGGKLPIKTLANPGYLSAGCSVDALTGNLAVTSFCSGTASSGCQGEGVLSIYPGGSGNPTKYYDKKIFFYSFCGYDDAGDLYVDGYDYVNSQEIPEFGELKYGQNSFRNITLRKPFVYPGGVQWDGTAIAVGDQTQQVIYQTRGWKGKVLGSTPLLDSVKVAQFFVARKFVVAPDVGDANVKFYKYPAGGYPVKTISGLDEPVGAVVSLKR